VLVLALLLVLLLLHHRGHIIIIIIIIIIKGKIYPCALTEYHTMKAWGVEV